jgi:ribosomal-protein-alanine N-acetyltransferase
VRLDTPRLRLEACSLELAEALLNDRTHAGAIAGALLPEGWPDDELAGLLPIYAKQLREDPSTLGFGVWIAVEREHGVVVGSAGFVGPPQEGALELGYGIHPDHRNSGYATEASGALVAWALEQPQIEEVRAECERTNAPSVRVLEKLELQQTGENGTRLVYAARR